jgi:transposase
MSRKELAIELYQQGFTYEYIGEELGVSKQRIHQLIKDYKNMGRRGREGKYRNIGVCQECKTNKAEVLHHKDFNNSNDSEENLEKLCRGCHIKRHTGKKRAKRANPVSVNNLTKSQLAQMLGISVQTVYRWQQQGMPVIKRGKMHPRYDYNQVEQWLTEMSNVDVS